MLPYCSLRRTNDKLECWFPHYEHLHRSRHQRTRGMTPILNGFKESGRIFLEELKKKRLGGSQSSKPQSLAIDPRAKVDVQKQVTRPQAQEDEEEEQEEEEKEKEREKEEDIRRRRVMVVSDDARCRARRQTEGRTRARRTNTPAAHVPKAVRSIFKAVEEQAEREKYCEQHRERNPRGRGLSPDPRRTETRS